MAEGAPPHQAWDPEEAARIITPLRDLPGATLPVLHALQDAFGYIHAEAIPLVAEALNLSRAEVVGVVNFYHDFRQEPPGRHILQLCRAEACQAMGSERVVRQVEAALGTAMGTTSADGSVTLRDVYCLGNCALSPAAMLDGNPVGRLTASRTEALLARVRQ